MATWSERLGWAEGLTERTEEAANRSEGVWPTQGLANRGERLGGTRTESLCDLSRLQIGWGQRRVQLEPSENTKKLVENLENQHKQLKKNFTQPKKNSNKTFIET